ncbi:DUF6944 family repetitive protein [Peribacillus muralis]|uniref:DUF6944 family repetitive protein n=1 Tax=Peribacillus muralis TaxID=264697 RepID=UPI003D08F093
MIIKGNLIQELGGGTAVAGAYENPDEPEQALTVTGTMLQAIGYSMQAIGGISELRNSILEKDQENDEDETQDENDEDKEEGKEEGKQKYQYPDLEE